MKSIDTLVDDLKETLVKGSELANDELCSKYGTLFGEMLKARLEPSSRQREGTLRMSNIGKPCERQLWYHINNQGEGESLPPEAYLKFMYGDLIELLMLFLVEAAGHEVTGIQDEQEIEGIKGHRDAVIDGTLVDVKSASTYSFRKFSKGTLIENDSFGYIDQLQSYLYAGQTDDKITDKGRGAFLVVDKTLGHIYLDIHEYTGKPYDKIYNHKKKLMESTTPPERAFEPEPDGASGNMKLGTQCSYCDFKKVCHPKLEAYAYSNGPRFLTTVKKEPNVPRIY